VRLAAVHSIFGARYSQLADRIDLLDGKLDAVILDVMSEHSERDDVESSVKQWNKTRKLTSIQLLTILGLAIRAEDLHLHFDHISMHIQCAILLATTRNKFIEGAEIQARNFAFITRTPDMEGTLSDYLEKYAMPEEHIATSTVTAIAPQTRWARSPRKA
jgi:hypothetical protein